MVDIKRKNVLKKIIFKELVTSLESMVQIGVTMYNPLYGLKI